MVRIRRITNCPRPLPTCAYELPLVLAIADDSSHSWVCVHVCLCVCAHPTNHVGPKKLPQTVADLCLRTNPRTLVCAIADDLSHSWVCVCVFLCVCARGARVYIYICINMRIFSRLVYVSVLTDVLQCVCCVAVCCSALQCFAVCCSMLQYVAVCCRMARLSTLTGSQCVVVCCSVLQCVAVCCSVLQCVALCYKELQCVAVCCSVL